MIANVTSLREAREALQARMSRAGAHIRSLTEIETALAEAWTQLAELRHALRSAPSGEQGGGGLQEA